MREIKFRTWLVKEQVMAYPTNPLQLTGRNGAVHCWLEQDLSEHKNPDYSGDTRCAIQEYTGLKDKIGREIFEGDILRIQTEDNPEDLSWELAEVMFKDGCFWINKIFDQPLNEIIVDNKVDGEIVGNIFENPELL